MGIGAEKKKIEREKADVAKGTMMIFPGCVGAHFMVVAFPVPFSTPIPPPLGLFTCFLACGFWLGTTTITLFYHPNGERKQARRHGSL